MSPISMAHPADPIPNTPTEVDLTALSTPSSRLRASSPMQQMQFGPRWQVSARSLLGTHLEEVDENQDNYLVIDTQGRALHLRDQREHLVSGVERWPAGHVRLAILDGMGGHGNGREVAEATVQGLLELPACGDLETLGERLDALHDRLQQRFKTEALRTGQRRPGTTLTLLELPAVGPGLLYHVGDSRLYQITTDQAHPLTVDHVPATAHLLQGFLDEQGWRQLVFEQDRAEISQAFVLGSTLFTDHALDDHLTPLEPSHLPPCLAGLADRRLLAIERGALLVLATDGMWACAQPHLWLQRWPALLAQPARRLDYVVDDLFAELITAPPDDLKTDNCTVIALRAQ